MSLYPYPLLHSKKNTVTGFRLCEDVVLKILEGVVNQSYVFDLRWFRWS